MVFDCTEYCTEKYQDCSNLCLNDIDCKHECDIELSGCLNHCPCQAGCPSGCEGKIVVPEMECQNVLKGWSVSIQVKNHIYIKDIISHISISQFSSAGGTPLSDQFS